MPIWRVSLPADSWVCHVCNFLEPEIQRQLIDHCQTNIKHLELVAYFLLSKFYSSNPMNRGYYWIVAFVATTIPSLHVLPSFLYCVEGCPPASKERVRNKIWLVKTICNFVIDLSLLAVVQLKWMWLMAVIWQELFVLSWVWSLTPYSLFLTTEW